MWRTWLFEAFLRWKMITLPILTNSLNTFLFKRLRECTFWTWEWKGLQLSPSLVLFTAPRRLGSTWGGEGGGGSWETWLKARVHLRDCPNYLRPPQESAHSSHLDTSARLFPESSPPGMRTAPCLAPPCTSACTWCRYRSFSVWSLESWK